MINDKVFYDVVVVAMVVIEHCVVIVVLLLLETMVSQKTNFITINVGKIEATLMQLGLCVMVHGVLEEVGKTLKSTFGIIPEMVEIVVNHVEDNVIINPTLVGISVEELGNVLNYLNHGCEVDYL